MGIVQRFERRLQGAVGDGLARVFGGGVVPKEVEADLQREAADRLQELPGGGLLAPNSYIISINQSDYDELASDHELTTRAFAKHLQDHLAEQGWQTYGDIRVTFEPSPTLHTGQFRTRGIVDPDVGRPPPGQGPIPRRPDRPSANPLSGAGPMTQNSGYDPDNERRGRAEYPGESRGARGFATPLSSPGAGRGGGYQNGGGYPPEQDYGRGGYQNGYDQPASGGYQNGYDQAGGYTQTQGYGGREQGGYPERGGYGAEQGGYGAQEPGYGERGGYGREQGGYGAQEPGYGGGAGGGYGAEPGYGEPGYGERGGYAGGAGGAGGGYNDHGGGYGEQAYNDRGGYAPEQGYTDAGGYGGGQAGAGYAQPGYGQQPQGYDRGGYGGQEAGYGQPPAPARGGGAGGYSPANAGGGGGYAGGFTATLQLDDGSGRTYQLREGSNIIGRGQDAHFRLPDTGVSRRHIEVRWDGQVAMLSDLGSTNGTLVNGSPVQDWQLADGDVIRAGHSEILIRIL